MPIGHKKRRKHLPSCLRLTCLLRIYDALGYMVSPQQVQISQSLYSKYLTFNTLLTVFASRFGRKVTSSKKLRTS